MAYVTGNPSTKKALRELVASGKARVFEPGLGQITDGVAFIEGPHYPKPHKWYAKVRVQAGLITKVLS